MRKVLLSCFLALMSLLADILKVQIDSIWFNLETSEVARLNLVYETYNYS